MKSLRLALTCLVAVAMMLTAVLSFGCAGTKDGYKTFTVRKGIGHFTFEYPATFMSLGAVPQPNLTVAWFNGPNEGNYSDETGGYTIPLTRLVVDVRAAEISYPSATRILERTLADKNTFYRDFRLIERAPLTVSGIQAEQVVFSLNANTGSTSRGAGIPPMPIVGRYVFFDYKGAVWSIYTESYGRLANRDKAYFEHALQSFKLLE